MANNSQLISNLLIKTTQQILLDSSANYIELEYQDVKKTTNGNFWLEYKYWTQGANAYNNDQLVTPITTGQTGFENPTIADFAAKKTNTFEERHYVDSNAEGGVYSNTFTIFDSVLNDFAITPALFMKIVNDVKYNIGNAYQTYLFQRFVGFHSKKTSYDKIDAKYDKPATIDETFLNKVFSDLNLELSRLNTSNGYNILTQKPTEGSTTAKVPQWYNGRSRQHDIFIDYKLMQQVRYFVKAKLFHLDQYQLVANSNLIEVNFDNWAELNPKFTTFIDSEAKFDKSLFTALYIIADRGNYQEFYWYDARVDFQTNKLFRNMYFYTQHGQTKYKKYFSEIVGIKKATA